MPDAFPHSGFDPMDRDHAHLAELLAEANRPQASLKTRFPALVEALERHFQWEEALMARADYPGLREHQAEHRRVLGELRRLEDRISRGATAFARAYVREQLPGWFRLHSDTLDTAFVTYLLARGTADLPTALP